MDLKKIYFWVNKIYKFSKWGLISLLVLCGAFFISLAALGFYQQMPRGQAAAVVVCGFILIFLAGFIYRWK